MFGVAVDAGEAERSTFGSVFGLMRKEDMKRCCDVVHVE